MADQMAGQWYLKACELGQSPSDRVIKVSNFELCKLSAIVKKTVHENERKFTHLDFQM